MQNNSVEIRPRTAQALALTVGSALQQSKRTGWRVIPAVDLGGGDRGGDCALSRLL
jgi:hypothetical protein